jgi:hypothetical protein
LCLLVYHVGCITGLVVSVSCRVLVRVLSGARIPRPACSSHADRLTALR